MTKLNSSQMKNVKGRMERRKEEKATSEVISDLENLEDHTEEFQ